jgi:hypothetical protein
VCLVVELPRIGVADALEICGVLPSASEQSQAMAVELEKRWLFTREFYSIPNGPPGPSTARARFGPALCGPTLYGPIDVSCRAVSGVVPGCRPRHGPIADFSGRAGTTARLARRAGVGLPGSAGPFPCHAV